MTIRKPTINFKDFFYWILLITLAILLFKQCPKKPISIAVINETEKKRLLDSSENVRAKQADSLTKIITQREDRADSILGESTVFEYERNQAWGVIKQRDDTIKSLASKVFIDNGSNAADCVELAIQSKFQSQKIREQEDLTVKLLDDLYLVAKIKDSTIFDERRIKDAALKQGLKTATAYSELFAKYKRLQPRASVWIGPEMQLSPSYQTVGGQIMYATKKGTGWQVGAGLTTDANYYLKVGLLFKISMRKQ
jgi:hypothetical protein